MHFLCYKVLFSSYSYSSFLIDNKIWTARKIEENIKEIKTYNDLCLEFK